jgi:alanyl-tRNA synthetase
MDSTQVREKFLNFFKEKGHVVVPSSSLVPQNDSSVLFTTAGMQQFKPYYINPDLAPAKNVASVQKCVRTNDIDEVGDETHLTFFEMLGNFSFGGYWKKEAIEYAYEFITKELGLTIDYVSVFKDDESGIPADLESIEIWKSIDPKLEIKEHKKEDNFWGPTGDEGPCGPTTEIYINGVEIWNIVFNEFYKTKEGKYEPLKIKGIDTGMGLERLLVQVQNKKNVFETDLFNGEKTREERIIADHVKASLFLASDGVRPGNVGQGYILRRLVRRAAKFSKTSLSLEIKKILKIYNGVYSFHGIDEIEKEETKFKETLEKGLKEFNNGVDPFTLFTSYGFPIELTIELAKEKGQKIDMEEFNRKMKSHQEISKIGADQKFKGGLAGTGEMEVKYHTATHLLHQALRDVLGPTVSQKGSNITSERLRFDFAFDRKMTDDEKKRVEDTVNEKIKMKLPVHKEVMSKADAEKTGALHFFGDKYGDEVNVYYIGDSLEDAYSKEFCGGPHVENIGDLGKFKIQKEEAVSAGVRRIKAILE